MLSEKDHRIADRNGISFLDSHLIYFLAALRTHFNVKLLCGFRHFRAAIRTSRMQGLHNAVHMSGLRLNDHMLAEKLLRRNTTQSLYP